MGTFCTSGACLLKSGADVSTAFEEGSGFQNPDIDTADEMWELLIGQAESFINAVTRINYTDTYTTLNADVKKILEDACSSYAAVSAIAYDTKSYRARADAQTLMDANWARFQECINLLKDKKQTDFIDGA